MTHLSSATRSVAFTLLLAFAGTAVAGDLYLRQLPRQDAGRRAVEAIGSRLRDEVISTGTFDLGAMQLVGAHGRTLAPKELVKLNLDLAGRIARLHEDRLPFDLAARSEVKPLTGDVVLKAAAYLAEVNAYSPRSGEETRLAKTVWAMLGKLGLKSGQATVVTSRARGYDETTSSRRFLTQMLFLDQASGRALVLYMIEGTM